MKYKAPNIILIIGYQDILDSPPPADRLSLVSKVSKDFLIAELAGLNYRLKGNLTKAVDNSFQTQLKELLYFCGGNNDLYEKYGQRIDRKSAGRQSIIFPRQAILLGLEELVQSQIPTIPDFTMNLAAWEAIFLYILSLNSEVTKLKAEEDPENVTLETLSPKLLPLSELLLINDPFYVVYRGWHLMEYLASNEETGDYLASYFESNYGVECDRFVFELYRMFMANKQQKKTWDFYYIIPEDEETKPLFDVLSERIPNIEMYKLLNIRKSPFYKVGHNHYILTDNNILLEKGYSQFINDFWFDKLKGKSKTNGKDFKMQDYKSIFGRFFETYVDNVFRHSFMRAKNVVLKTFDELKIGNPVIECADLYFRQGSKVLLGEVKSTAIYDDQKYGGTMEALYKNDRDKFFDDFGVNQVVTSIFNFEANLKVLDPKISELDKIRIWPIIVFNEKLFQTPFMSQIFADRFKELMVDFKSKFVYSYPLTIIHISDLENLEVYLHNNPDSIWNLLTSHFSQNKKLIPPFNMTVNRHDIRASYGRVMEKIAPLFAKFKKKEENE